MFADNHNPLNGTSTFSQQVLHPFKTRANNVLYWKDHRGRIMGKTGTLYTLAFADGNMARFLKDMFISIIDLVGSVHLIPSFV